MKILITAFEPFGNSAYNPSQAMVDGLREKDVETLILPTSYAGAAEKLKEACARIHPDFAILTGVAGGRSEICLEYCALNTKDASIPDNDGETACGQSVIENRENALFTSFDLHTTTAVIRDSGIPCRVSYHAGTFVCNSTYYHLLASGIPGVFMHIPYDESRDAADGQLFLALSESRRALSILIQELRAQFSAKKR